MTYEPEKFGPLVSAEEERKRLVAAFGREDELQRKVDALEVAGDKLATAVQERWTGHGRCDCDCCTAARNWVELRR